MLADQSAKQVLDSGDDSVEIEDLDRKHFAARALVVPLEPVAPALEGQRDHFVGFLEGIPTVGLGR
ncbi:MAG: hypothetical protein JRI25_04625 [Deltaproteobacteria bacterium]|nr:hypothetical protein [Deltaproteobacteria bacterium]MBW2253864.1 hypothetical protein [Deltaproteobacteria bacterium]